MESRELRVGNWVMGNAPYQVSLSEMNTNCSYIKMGKTSYFEPIPLKEQWLLYFGFKPTEKGFYRLSKNLEITVNFVVFCGEKFICELHYVHQLQNLHQSLFGEELILKK